MQIPIQPMPDGLVHEEYLVVDTETSGTDGAAEVIEVAALRFRDGVVTERYVSPVRPTRPVPSGAIAVHGLSADKLADAPPRSVVDAWLRDFVRPDDVVFAHHAEFDRPRLPCIADRTWACSCRLARHLWPGVEDGYSNQHLKAWLRLDLRMAENDEGRAHRAEYDAFVTGLLVHRELLAYQGIHPYGTMAEVVAYAESPIDVRILHVRGKYFGAAMDAVPVEYLRWILADQSLPPEQRYIKKTLDRDTRATIERHGTSASEAAVRPERRFVASRAPPPSAGQHGRSGHVRSPICERDARASTINTKNGPDVRAVGAATTTHFRNPLALEFRSEVVHHHDTSTPPVGVK